MVAKIRCGISTAFHNKTNLTGKQSAFGDSFIPTALTVADLAAHVTGGGAFTPGNFQSRARTKKTFVSGQLLGLDFDSGLPGTSVTELLKHPLIAGYAALVYPTPSHTPEHPKTRVVFALSDPVDTVARWECLQRGLIQHVADLEPDSACKDAARLFYGSDQPGAYVNPAAVLPIGEAGALTATEAEADYIRATAGDAPRQPYTGGDTGYIRAYVEKAIADELATLAGTGKGGRNQQTFKSACAVFGFAKGGYCDRESLARDLAAAAAQTGLPAGEITATLASAWQSATPRHVPEPRPYETFGSLALQSEPDSPDAPLFADGLPDSWRSAMLNYLPPSTAPVFELLMNAIHQNLLDPAGFTLAELYSANEKLVFGLSEKTIRYVINALENEFWQKFPISMYSLLTGKSCQNPPTGRTPSVFALFDLSTIRANLLRLAMPRIYEKHHPTDDNPVLATFTDRMTPAAGELNEQLQPVYDEQQEPKGKARWKAKCEYLKLESQLANHHSTPLPDGWPLDNAKHYRDAFLHATVQAAPDENRSRREIGDLLGISTRSVACAVDRAGLVSERQYEAVELNPSGDIDRQVRQHGKALGGFAVSLTITAPDGRVTEQPYSPDMPPKLASGSKLAVRYSLPNKQIVVSDEPPAPAVPRQSEPRQVEDEPRQVEPARPKYYGPGYDPDWLYAQLVLALKLLKKIDAPLAVLVNMKREQGYTQDDLTAEILTYDPLVDECLELGGVRGSQEYPVQTAIYIAKREAR